MQYIQYLLAHNGGIAAGQNVIAAAHNKHHPNKFLLNEAQKSNECHDN
ncbi:MAG: hypothetical protein R8L53_06040 [Mariprofundales bacterium]